MKRGILISMALAMIFSAAHGAVAQTTDHWPERPIRIIVPYPPGGSADSQTRIVGEQLSKKWKQPVIVENRPGGNTVIATDPVAKANPDGYTLLLSAMPYILNPIMMDKLPYDTEKDLVPVTMLTTKPNILVAALDFNVNDVQELIARAKASPGEVAFASAGLVTATHLSGELFSDMTGVKMMHVPYKGSAAAHQDLIAGRVHVMFDNAALAQVQAGRLKALGVTSSERLPWLPDVPTVAEQGLPGYEAIAWYGIFAPQGTSTSIVEKIAADITEIVRSPDLRDQWVAMGAVPGGGTPEEFRSYLGREKGRWVDLIKERNIKY